jgi:hypothetical protein
MCRDQHIVRREFWRKYAEDIAAAWGLVEEMKAEKYDITITEQPGWQTGCRVAPRGEFNTSRVLFKTADTAPRAICLAFLAWKASK